VYLISQFTPEALVLEGLLICVLAAGYSAFWLLRKRRIGVIEHAVPAGLVKEYLGGLIQEAEFIRMQLFGLLKQGDAGFQQGALPRSFGAGAGGGAALAELEAKLSEQQKSLERVINEKIQLEADLAAAKGAVGEGSGPNRELEAKLKELQGRLDEYSIIEDDLANLKRLTQENAALKAQLASAPKGGAAPAPSPAPVAPAVAVAAAAVAAAPASAPIPPATPVAAAPADASPLEMATEGVSTGTQEEEAVPVPEAPALPPAAAAVAPPTPTPAPAPAAPAQPLPEAMGPEGDLVAEFEKILSG